MNLQVRYDLEVEKDRLVTASPRRFSRWLVLRGAGKDSAWQPLTLHLSIQRNSCKRPNRRRG